MKLSKEAKVGMFAIVTIAMLYIGFNYLKGFDIFSQSNKFLVIYDNIDGLTASNPVQLNGLTVGRVERIDILQEQGNKLLVTLDVDKKLRIGRGSKAVLADGGLLGGKLVILRINQQGEPLNKNDTLVGIKDVGITSIVREKAIPILSNVDSLTLNLNRIIKQFDKTALALNQMLQGAEAATSTLKLTVNENRVNLRTLMGNLAALSASLAETGKQMQPLLAKANSLADSLNALELSRTLSSVNRSIDNLQGLLADVNQGKGTLGKFAKDDSLYVNMNRVSASLNQLLVDFRERPKRYVHFSLFGAKDRDSKKGQKLSSTVTIMVDTIRQKQ